MHVHKKSNAIQNLAKLAKQADFTTVCDMHGQLKNTLLEKSFEKWLTKLGLLTNESSKVYG